MYEIISQTPWLTRLLHPRRIRLSSMTIARSAPAVFSERTNVIANTRVWSTVVLAAGIAACASTPVAPTPDMTRAEVAIAQAQKAGAGDLANDSLQAAQKKLDEAKSAGAKGEARRSQDLVDEAMADAQLADLTAQHVKSAKAEAEVDKSISAIETEAGRRTPQ